MNKHVDSANNAPVVLAGVRAVLLDIEGTTSSIKFVYDVMFPYVRSELNNFLQKHWNEPKTVHALDAIARDLNHAGLEDWVSKTLSKQQSADQEAKLNLISNEVYRLMDGDIKATGLKELQGLIWDGGYSEGKLTSHVYEDVPVALKAWSAAGVDVRIYSSGSINAQKVFFEHTTYGALTQYLNGHYDTTTGPKKEENSYRKIAAEMGLPPRAILFLSDTPAELEAAEQANMQVALVAREPVINETISYPVINTFEQIQI